MTAAFGMALRGLPIVRPRNPDALQRARTAGRLFLGEVELWNAHEAPALYDACRSVAAAGGLPGDVRARMRQGRRPTRKEVPRLSWVVEQATRNGAPTSRFAWLPRLRWPGMVVVDHCGAAGSGRGRYHLMAHVPGAPPDVVRSTGCQFHTLEALWEHLESYHEIKTEPKEDY